MILLYFSKLYFLLKFLYKNDSGAGSRYRSQSRLDRLHNTGNMYSVYTCVIWTIAQWWRVGACVRTGRRPR